MLTMLSSGGHILAGVILLAIAATGVLGQHPWCKPTPENCPQDLSKCNDYATGPALQENGCFYDGCPCGHRPFNITSCNFPSLGQVACPKACGGFASEYIIAANGCPSCVCWRDNPPYTADFELDKPGTCPPNSATAEDSTGLTTHTSNTPRRVFYSAPRCDKDLDCWGIKKCCNFAQFQDKRCVDPEPQCPSTLSYGYGAKTCTTNADCDYGDACCGRRYGSKRCVKGVLPKFLPIRYRDSENVRRTVPSPEDWA